MSTYTLYYQAEASTSVTVEADTLDEAIDLGYEALPGGLCHQCANHYDVGDLEFDETSYEVDGKFVTEAKS